MSYVGIEKNIEGSKVIDRKSRNGLITEHTDRRIAFKFGQIQ